MPVISPYLTFRHSLISKDPEHTSLLLDLRQVSAIKVRLSTSRQRDLLLEYTTSNHMVSMVVSLLDISKATPGPLNSSMAPLLDIIMAIIRNIKEAMAGRQAER